VRDAVIDFTAEWSERTEIPAARFIAWIGLQRGKFYAWKERYGKANEHNGRIPRDHWLTPDEKKAILDFHEKHPLDGYRRLAFMMIVVSHRFLPIAVPRPVPIGDAATSIETLVFGGKSVELLGQLQVDFAGIGHQPTPSAARASASIWPSSEAEPAFTFSTIASASVRS
jgi:hypothetical protein